MRYRIGTIAGLRDSLCSELHESQETCYLLHLPVTPLYENADRFRPVLVNRFREEKGDLHL